MGHRSAGLLGLVLVLVLVLGLGLGLGLGFAARASQGLRLCTKAETLSNGAVTRT